MSIVFNTWSRLLSGVFFMSESSNKSLKDQETEIKFAIANCILAWSGVEIHLSLLLNSMVQAKPMGIALTIWDSVISFEAKLSCLNSVAGEVLNKDAFNIWHGLSQKVRKASKKRNEIAHSGLIELHPQKMLYLVPYLSVGKMSTKKLTADEIESRAEYFHKLQDALRWLISYINVQERGSEPLSPVPELIQPFLCGEASRNP